MTTSKICCIVSVVSLITRALSTLLPGVMFPWAPTPELKALVYSDIFGDTGADIVTRETAMRVAPIKRGRAVIVGRLSDLPFELGEFVNGEFVADQTQPAWLTQTGSIATSAWHRFAWSLDDVLFTRWSLWAVDRDEAGTVVAADRIDQTSWRFDQASPTGVAILLGNLVWAHVTDETSVILFSGPDDGLLTTAHDTITGWRHMERSWVGRVRNPIPAMALKEREANGVTQAEAQRYVEAWAAARTSPNGAVGFLPHGLDLEVYGEVKADLFNEGRNAARIDVANHMNLPVAYLDGSTATSSLTYVTQEGSRAQVIDDLEYWVAPFEARLSQPDITGDPDKVVRLNRSNLTAVPNDDHGPEPYHPAVTTTTQEATE